MTGDITSQTRTFASITSEPTTWSGYGITDAYTATTIDSKLSGYLPLSGGTLTGNISTKSFKSGTDSLGFYLEANSNLGLRIQYNKSTTGSDYDQLLLQNGVLKFNSKEVIHSGNYNSYAPTLTGTGASGTWGISISGNAATATNADTLDDLHAADFAKVKNHIVSGTDVNSIGYGVTDDGNMYYGPMATFGTADYFIEIQSPYNKPELYYRQYNTNGYSDKKQFAFTDSNVASATKLQTQRTLWGKPFDGSADVSGNISMGYSKIYWLNDANNYYIDIDNAGQASYKAYFGHIFYTHGVQRLLIHDSGNILIGTTTDNGYKLQVNGSERVYGDLIVDGEVSALVA